ncbi:MAG: phosphatase PAP2 family protein [Flavobacteriales bacterium]|nr:phosphatase PAP2 family protein [Flavobacteriales bacterium]
MKKTCLLVFLTISYRLAISQSISTIIDSTKIETNVHRIPTEYKVSLFLFAAGYIASTENAYFTNKKVTSYREKTNKSFHIEFDDFLQHASLAGLYSAKLLGAKTTNTFKHQTTLLLKAELLMMAIVFPTKYLTKKTRPDNSASEAFPSGHTAQAFLSATFMSKELGQSNILYSIGAYTSATAVGVLRVLNNKHDATDVLVGAGIGILSTEIIYSLDKRKRQKNSKTSFSLLPIYSKDHIGLSLALQIK